MKRILVVIIGLGIPVTAIIVLFPWYDRVHPLILGFPFLYFWIFLWFPLTSLCLNLAWRMEKGHFQEGG